jgi:hypothetical protein
MSEVDLILNGEHFPICDLAIRQVCTKFPTNPFPAQYFVTSDVSKEVFKMFLSALKGERIEVTKGNFPFISVLCKEFGFEVENSSYRFCELEGKIEELRVQVERLFGEVAALGGIPRIVSEHLKEITELQKNVFVFAIPECNGGFQNFVRPALTTDEFADRFRLSRNVFRVPRKTVFASLAWQ